jgi:NTE family protein
MQGGGAPGCYQAGVYQAMHEAGIEPDWVVGTSIGTINSAIIAGNKAVDRLTRLREFCQSLGGWFEVPWAFSRHCWPACRASFHPSQLLHGVSRQESASNGLSFFETP